jgi:hypothetical protein
MADKLSNAKKLFKVVALNGFIPVCFYVVYYFNVQIIYHANEYIEVKT